MYSHVTCPEQIVQAKPGLFTPGQTIADVLQLEGSPSYVDCKNITFLRLLLKFFGDYIDFQIKDLLFNR